MSPIGTREGPCFDHLLQMTDRRGLTENAAGGVSRPDRRYRVDNTARALALVSREAGHDQQLQRPRHLYLTFVLNAIASDGSCHHQMNGAGTWLNRSSVGHCWGYAL